jgi:uncharacterized protein
VFAVDTNIFLYAHFELYPQHAKAREFCQDLLAQADDWCIAWQVVYEYLRVATHPAIHMKPLTIQQALADMEPYLLAEQAHILVPTNQHRPVLEAVAASLPGVRGNFIHDVHYATLLHEHGVSLIYTADTDFKKFGFLDVVDPTA